MDGFVPSDRVQENSETYQNIDALLQVTPDANKSQWIKAAAEVTSWNAVGGIDGFGSDLEGQSKVYLRFVQQKFVPEKLSVARTLQRGEEVTGLEGLLGQDIDNALVEKEQDLVGRFSDEYFKGKPDLDKRKVTKTVSAVTQVAGVESNPANDLNQPEVLELLSNGGNKQEKREHLKKIS